MNPELFFNVPKFKPDFKARLVAALRSGQYQQAEEVLCRKNGEYSFCCLGVACLVNHPDKTVEELFTSYVAATNSRYFMNGPDYQTPPEEEFLSWIIERGGFGANPQPAFNADVYLGLWEIPKSDINKSRITLTSLNDGGFSFHQIADCIEYFL